MTDKEIRIISRKKKELFEKANPIAILKLMFEKPTEGNVRKDPKEAKEEIESFEAMNQMKMLDDLMEKLGYEWDISQSLYVEKNRKAEGKTEATVIHHHDEIKDKDFKRDLLNNPELRIAVKGNGIAIIGEADTMKLMSLTCELLKIISKSGAGAVRATIDLYNLKTTDKTLKLHLRKQEEKD